MTIRPFFFLITFPLAFSELQLCLCMCCSFTVVLMALQYFPVKVPLYRILYHTQNKKSVCFEPLRQLLMYVLFLRKTRILCRTLLLGQIFE